jgi:cyanophycinase
VRDATQSNGHRKGEVVAIGGAEDKLRSRLILRRVIDLAGGSEARIAVIPTASRRADAGVRYCQLFAELGASQARVLPFRERKDCADTELLQIIREATCVFLTGGNQLRLSSVIGGTPAARLMRHRNAEGMIVAGTSAGAAIMSEHMIAYGREGSTPRAGMVAIVPGLGFVNQIIVDQHFRQRDRLGRLLTALAYNPFAVGIGLDEDTAIIVDAQREIEVVGTNAVTIVDASALTHSAMGFVRQGEPVSLTGLTLHVLVDGGRFDIKTREAQARIEHIEDVRESQLEAADRDVKGIDPYSDERGPLETQDLDMGEGEP